MALSFFLLPILVYGQETTTPGKTRFKKFIQSADYKIAISNKGIGMPPNFVNGKAHPGLIIGLQKKFNAHSHWDYHFDLGYFAIHSLQRAAYLKPGIGYSIALGKRFVFRPNINLAVMRVGQINDEFQFVSGQYKKAARHRLQVAPGLGLESFIKIAESEKRSYDAMLGYEFGVQLPFSSLSSILPLNQLKIGVRIKK